MLMQLCIYVVLQELIQLIKRTRIPIICICNEKGHTKIRSLSNYCFDLRFQRPRVEQIKVSRGWPFSAQGCNFGKSDVKPYGGLRN